MLRFVQKVAVFYNFVQFCADQVRFCAVLNMHFCASGAILKSRRHSVKCENGVKFARAAQGLRNDLIWNWVEIQMICASLSDLFYL